MLTSLAATVTSLRSDITLGPRWRSRISLGVRASDVGVREAALGVRAPVGVRAVLVVLEESMKEIELSRCGCGL